MAADPAAKDLDFPSIVFGSLCVQEFWIIWVVMAETTLRTADEVFDALGGLPGVQDLTRSKYKTVHYWKQSASFPSRFYVLMTGALRERGLSADPSLWDMEVPAEAEA
jgi:hypothetical protein